MSVTAYVKRRQLGDRGIRYTGSEMLQNRNADKVFCLEGYKDTNDKVRWCSALRVLRSAMSYNVFASAGERLHVHINQMD